MTTPKLLCELDRGVLTLTLNRPDKRNAIDNELAQALLDALRAAADDPEVGAVCLAGNGPAFCAGRDISAPPTERDLDLVQAVACAIVEHPLPVLVALHGWTVGAGLEWALCADVVLAADTTRFKLPEASLGVFVTGGLVATLPAVAGPIVAKSLLLSGDAFDARQAQAWGLVYQVVAAADLTAQAAAMSRRLAGLDREVAGQFKRVLNSIGMAGFRAAVSEESRVMRQLTRLWAG